MGTATLLGLHPAALLEYGGRRLPVSSACLERSEVLSSLLRQAVTAPGESKPCLALDSTQVASLQRLVGQPLPPLSLERFLAALGSGSGQKTVLERCSEVGPTDAARVGRRRPPAAPCHRPAAIHGQPCLPRRPWRPPRPLRHYGRRLHRPAVIARTTCSNPPGPAEPPAPQVEQVIQILKLADWFSAHELRQACDERLCTLLHALSNRQQVSDSREEAASQALEAGVQHCLTKTGGCWAEGSCARPGLGLAHVPAWLPRLLCAPELARGGEGACSRAWLAQPRRSSWIPRSPQLTALPAGPRPGPPCSRLAAAVGAAAAEPRRQGVPWRGSRRPAERRAALAAADGLVPGVAGIQGRRRTWLLACSMLHPAACTGLALASTCLPHVLAHPLQATLAAARRQPGACCIFLPLSLRRCHCSPLASWPRRLARPQDRAARRRRRLHACLMADDQLKVRACLFTKGVTGNACGQLHATADGCMRPVLLRSSGSGH